MDAKQVEQALNVSSPTAIDRMKELGGTGICEFQPGNSNTSEPGKVCLSDAFQWLLVTPFKDSGVERNDRTKHVRQLANHTERNRLEGRRSSLRVQVQGAPEAIQPPTTVVATP
jgi:hypothetical protein